MQLNYTYLLEAYMADTAWRKICPWMCKGIRAMEGIREHPELWVVLSLDDYGSHLDAESLLVFHNHKLRVLKEEGDTLQVSQAYDKDVAKQDKKWA